MLVLLPPSEGKRPGGEGPAYADGTLSFPSCDPLRARLLRSVVAMANGNPVRARERLGLSAAQDNERAADAVADEAPTLPAGLRYAGVLYDGLDYPGLAPRARRVADASVVTLSMLWGGVRPVDPVPHYRLGVGARLPRLRPLPTVWAGSALRAELDAAIANAGGALDLRSTGYLAAYRPGRDVAPAVHAVRIVGSDGRRAASSYVAKRVKGLLVRELCRAGRVDLDGCAPAASRLGLDVGDLVEAGGPSRGLLLEVPAGWTG